MAGSFSGDDGSGGGVVRQWRTSHVVSNVFLFEKYGRPPYVAEKYSSQSLALRTGVRAGEGEVRQRQFLCAMPEVQGGPTPLLLGAVREGGERLRDCPRAELHCADSCAREADTGLAVSRERGGS